MTEYINNGRTDRFSRGRMVILLLAIGNIVAIGLLAWAVWARWAQ